MFSALTGGHKCLTKKPQYEPLNYMYDFVSEKKMDLQIYGSWVYENGKMRDRPAKEYNGEGIACSICEVNAYGVIMIPGMYIGVVRGSCVLLLLS